MRAPFWLVAAALLVVSAWLGAAGCGGRASVPSESGGREYFGSVRLPGERIFRFNNAAEPEYIGGKWIEITYGRPIKRGRDLWGSAAGYGQMLSNGAPVWRAGANVSSRLKTEVPLVINNKTVARGEYSLFIDLKPNNWTLIVSSWPAQTTYNPGNTNALWGSFGYTPTVCDRTPQPWSRSPSTFTRGVTWS